MIQNIPDELSFQILSYLEEKDLGKCCTVNILWNEFASENMFWKLITTGLKIPENMSIKSYIDSFDARHVISTLDSFKERCEKFVKTEKFNIPGSFVCLFPSSPNISFYCKLELVSMLYNTLPKPSLPSVNNNLKELFIFKEHLSDSTHKTFPKRYNTTLSQVESYNSLVKCSNFSKLIITWKAPKNSKQQMEFLASALEKIQVEGLDRLKAEALTYHQDSINSCIQAVDITI